MGALCKCMLISSPTSITQLWHLVMMNDDESESFWKCPCNQSLGSFFYATVEDYSETCHFYDVPKTGSQCQVITASPAQGLEFSAFISATKKWIAWSLINSSCSGKRWSLMRCGLALCPPALERGEEKSDNEHLHRELNKTIPSVWHDHLGSSICH